MTAKTPTADTLSGINQIGLSARDKSFETGAVNCFDFKPRTGAFNSVKNPLIRQQSCVTIHLPQLRVKSAQLQCDFEAGSHRLKVLAVGDGERYATTQLCFVLASLRRELNRCKLHAGKVQLVQCLHQKRAVEPRRTYPLKWRSGSPADRQVGGLKQSDAWIQNCFVEIAHIRRWVDPLKSGLVKVIGTLPTFHWNHYEFEIELQFSVEHARQFTNGHTMPYRQLMKTDERLFTAVQQRSFYSDAIDGVGPVQHDKF